MKKKIFAALYAIIGSQMAPTAHAADMQPYERTAQEIFTITKANDFNGYKSLWLPECKPTCMTPDQCAISKEQMGFEMRHDLLTKVTLGSVHVIAFNRLSESGLSHELIKKKQLAASHFTKTPHYYAWIDIDAPKFGKNILELGYLIQKDGSQGAQFSILDGDCIAAKK
jgi:hypothetical protein